MEAFNSLISGVSQVLAGVILLGIGLLLVWKTDWKIRGWSLVTLGVLLCLLAVRNFYRSLFYDESSGMLEPGYDHAQ